MILEQFYSKRKRVKQDVSKIVMKEKNPTITIYMLLYFAT